MPTLPSTAPHAVFVSHAHADNDLCDRYVAALRARGLDVWYDRTNMQAGHFLNREIETQLERRSAFVVLLTPASVASYWVNLEVTAFRDLAAHDPTRMMLPVRIAACGVPLLMRGIYWIDAVGKGFAASLDEMAVALGVLPASNIPAPAIPEDAVKRANELVEEGDMFYGYDKFREAEDAYRRALEFDPGNASIWYAIGETLATSGHPNGALNIYNGVVELDPNYAVAWASKGKVLQALGRMAEAEAAKQRARELGWDE